ncbi:1319_t:CDS:1 [Racocetra fulgida]|uniref:1319_t:CDS:1 n=1 Tax=Racocetra fulgida TaxID=60492 RepID=A0A9N9DBJ1_9GLOM|nr:1319_t:CDS:1 [Racocetra fulgida]
MPPRNHGKSSGKPKCPGCGRHFADLREYVLRMHGTTISELHRRIQLQRSITIQRPNENPNSRQETPNPHTDENHEHVSALTREENHTDSLHQESPNSRQETPNPRSDGNIEHVSALTKEEGSPTDYTDSLDQEFPNSLQETPTPNIIFNHSTFNNCTFTYYYY